MRQERYPSADMFDDQDPVDSPKSNPVLRLLRGRWHWAITLAVLLGTAGGFVGYLLNAEQFQAVSTIELKPDYTVPVSVQDLSVYEPYLNFVSGERRTLRSQEVIEDAMTRPEWTEALAQRPADLPPITVGSFSEGLNINGPSKNDTVLYIEYTDSDPVTARAGVNVILAAYREVHKLTQAEKIDDDLRLLQDQLSALEKEKATAESQIKLIIPGEEMVTINARLQAKLGELANMEFRLSEVELEIGPYLKAAGNEDSDSGDLLQSQEMMQLLEDKKRLEDTYIYLTEVLSRGEQMRDVVQVRRSLTMIERKIVELEKQALTNSVQDGGERQLPPQIASLMARRDALIEKIDQLTSETNDLGAIISSAEDYRLKLEDIRQSIRLTRDKINQYEATGALTQRDAVSRVVIGPPAQTPTMPYNTEKRIQFAALGGLFGAGLGLGLTMLVGISDRRLRHAADTLEGMPEANVLGILPTLPAKLTDPEDAEVAAHCVHHIRTLLQIGGSNRVFSITSPVAGSGKSSLATALGMSFATTDVRTLVIDCDLVGAGLSRRMGTVVHDSLDKVIRRHKMMDEADLSRLMTRATSLGKSLEDVLREEKALSQEKIEAALRLQKDTALGILDACGPAKLRPPVINNTKSEDLYIFIDEDESGLGQGMYGDDSPPIEFITASAGHGRLRECVGHTDIENLFVLPVGKARPSDASRLSPAAIRELIRQAREAFDIVLIDTGPVLGSLEASIVSAEADATVVIVARGDSKSLANRMLEQLRSVRANIVGLVFNHAHESEINHASYASVVSQERRATRGTRSKRLDQTRSARLGPLGSAVASFTEEPANNNGQPANASAITFDSDVVDKD